MSKGLTGDFRKYMDKSFLGSWDVPETGDLILTIDYVTQEEVQNKDGKKKKLTLHFKEREYKPMALNTTNSNRISDIYGSKKVEDWEGKKIAIYTEKVSAFGGITDGLRIRPYPPKTDEYYCEDCGELITDRDGHKAKAIANNALTKFGRYLCYDCAVKAKKEQEENV